MNMDHTNYTNRLLGNNLVSAAGDHLNDHMILEEPPIQPHHHHQICYDSVWPNFPLQLHHQVPSSSTTRYFHHDHDHHHHNHQQMVLAANYNTYMEQEEQQIQEEPEEEEVEEELGAMKEMMYKIAAMQPVDIDPATLRKPKRRNVRISEDPQSIAARHRRERISERIRILQRLVPGGTKMDTASMLDEAISYVKFLKRQIRLLQHHHPPPHQQCVNVNNGGGVVFGSTCTTSETNAVVLGGGGGQRLDWPPPPPIEGSATDNNKTVTRAPIGLAAFGGSRGDNIVALSFNHEVLSD